MVVAPNDLGDAHIAIVNHHHEVISGRAVGTEDDKVVEFLILEYHVTAKPVTDGDRAFLRRFKADDGSGSFGCRAGPVAAGAVVFRFEPFCLRFLTFFIEFLRRAEAGVGLSFIQQLIDLFPVENLPFCLSVWSLIPVQSQPLHRREDFLD